MGCGDADPVTVKTDLRDIATHIERVIDAVDTKDYDKVRKSISETCKAIEQAQKHAPDDQKRKLGMAHMHCREAPSALNTRCPSAALKNTLEQMLEYL